MFYCTNCGKPYNEGTKFCGFCGSALKEGEKKTVNNYTEPVQTTELIQTSEPIQTSEHVQTTEPMEMRHDPIMKTSMQNSNSLPLDNFNSNSPVRQPHKHEKHRIRYIITSLISIAITLVILGLTGVIDFKPAAKTGSIREKSFDEPEDAITYYIEHLKNGDLNGMLAACDVNEKAANFDFEGYIKRLQIWNYNTMLTPDYDTYADINRYNAANEIINSIKDQYLALTASDNETIQKLLDERHVTQMGDFNTKLIDPEVVRKLKLVRIDLADPEQQISDQISENMLKGAEIYGGDDFREYAVLYELNDKYYMAGFLLYHYNGGWKISSLKSYLAGIDRIYPTTMSEYKNTINE